jgi:TolA-binding protein
VTHLLNVGEVDEAVEANRILVEKHPKHSSADNLEFLLGLALLEKKKKPEAAKERFLAVIRNSPDSYWAKCARNLLDRMERESAAKAQPK